MASEINPRQGLCCTVCDYRGFLLPSEILSGCEVCQRHQGHWRVLSLGLSTCCSSSFLMAVLAVRCSAFRMVCSSLLCHWGIATLATTCKIICSVRTLNCTPRHKVLVLWKVRLEHGLFPDLL